MSSQAPVFELAGYGRSLCDQLDFVCLIRRLERSRRRRRRGGFPNRCNIRACTFENLGICQADVEIRFPEQSVEVYQRWDVATSFPQDLQQRHERLLHVLWLHMIHATGSWRLKGGKSNKTYELMYLYLHPRVFKKHTFQPRLTDV